MQVFWRTGIERLKTIHIICYYGSRAFYRSSPKQLQLCNSFMLSMQPLNTYLGPWKKKPSSNLRKVDFRAGQVTFKAYYPKTSSNKIIIT